MNKKLHPLLPNREYHSRKRYEAFLQLLEQCRALRAYPLESTPLTEFFPLFEEIELNISRCLEHAQAAISGYSKKQFPSFREDPQHGYLEEELLLLSMLEEKLFSVRFLKKSIETEQHLTKYVAQLERLKTPGATPGFIDQLIDHIAHLQQLSRKEIESLISVQGQRSELAKTLFERVHNLQPVRPS